MNVRDLMARPGEKVEAEKWNELVRLVGKLLDGPQVCAPLGLLDGAICLSQEFAPFDGITTASINPRSGSTMGSGPVRLVLPRKATLTTLTNATALVTAYNYTGTTIPANQRVVMFMIGDQLRILGRDCSGVAP